MTVLSDYVARMVTAGMDQEEAFQIVGEIFAAGAAAEASRPSAGALRTRKWRANRPVEKRHQSVTCDTEQDENKSVTKRHKASQGVTCDNTPLSSLNIDNRKRGARLSPEWQPDERDRAFAKQLGWSDAQIDSEAANFRDYWIARPGSGGCKLDWPATWRKWMRSSKIKPAGSTGPISTLPRDWEGAARQWKAFRRWPRGHGPDPDSPGCQCPREILQKHMGAA